MTDGRTHARRREAVLQREGHAVQRRERLAARLSVVELPRARSRALGVERDDRVELGVARLDACELRLERIARRELAVADRPSQRLRTLKGIEVRHANSQAR